MKVVIEVLTAATMLGEAGSAWAALAIMADATEVAPALIG
jgi:hypothetical protein